MTKSLISVDSKEIMNHFYSKMGKKVKPGDAGRIIISAKRLLLDYSKEEIIFVIDKHFKNPPPGGIYSFGFIAYEFEKHVKPYKQAIAAEKAREASAKITDFGALPQASNAGSKMKKFGVKKEVNWDE